MLSTYRTPSFACNFVVVLEKPIVCKSSALQRVPALELRNYLGYTKSLLNLHYLVKLYFAIRKSSSLYTYLERICNNTLLLPCTVHPVANVERIQFEECLSTYFVCPHTKL